MDLDYSGCWQSNGSAPIVICGSYALCAGYVIVPSRVVVCLSHIKLTLSFQVILIICLDTFF